MELTKKEPEAANKCFAAYIFYETVKGGKWCTCTNCGRTYLIKNSTKNYAEQEVLREGHNGGARCARCGRLCEIKSLGKSKSRKNLYEEQRIVFVRKLNENLIRAYGVRATKNYNTSDINPKIRYDLCSEYEFRPGNVKQYKFNYHWYSGTTSKDLCKVAKEPFGRISGTWYSVPDNTYTIIGLEKFKDSFLRYHLLSAYAEWYKQRYYRRTVIEINVMSYLCRFCEHPQIEMLQKMGYYDVVENLVEINNKSFPYVNWKAKDIASFFKLSKQEFNVFRKEKLDLDFLRFKKIIEKYFEKQPFLKTIEQYRKINSFRLTGSIEDGINVFKKRKIPIKEGLKYIFKQYEKLTEKSLSGLFSYMDDYYHMGRELGYDFSNHNVAYPKNLIAAHDTAAALQRAMLEEKRQKEMQAKERAAVKYLKKYDKQYVFADKKFMIVVPHTVSEIIEEGKKQSHCVGGYAARHMEGTLTICFLRAVSEPDKPLYTIEMHGKSLTQVQGYNNRTPLTPDAKEFFDKWLKWVENGSKRDAKGNPVFTLKIKKTA